ncbi:U3 small nucleolar RNA-associated protein 25 homolog [Diorhabda carinulata]|uniref:U3 small nucleolar RNA-associated protein 25 homolog n=1 Tax=Diorhabda carinulata TaxID=1163345 RepID=UPI0025A25B02|nr:U3 small nucleolar RNA-associated protein 25 homolog [Diorhabda carinulata]
MARRGKVKYKDVVKKTHMQQKKTQKLKSRKKFKSFIKKNSKTRTFSSGTYYEPQHKQQKLNQELRSETSSSEEETVDLNNLINTFSNKGNKKAIDSSSDSEGYILFSNSNEVTNDDSDDENSDFLEEQSYEANQCKSGEYENNDIFSDVEKDDVCLSESKNDSDSYIALVNDEMIDDKEDPFNKHLLYDLHESMLETLQMTPVNSTNISVIWPVLRNLHFQIPKCELPSIVKEDTFTLSGNKTYATQGRVPNLMKYHDFDKLYIKSQIVGNLPKVNKAIINSEKFTPLQEEMFSIINNYQDFYYPERTFSNSEEIRYIYCVHAVNHILKTRLKVIHHNARLTKKDEIPEEFRDQCLVRPKVLVILPFKDAAYKTIQIIISLIISEDKGNVMNKNRFIEDYTGKELFFPKKNPKPEDYELLFQGNTSDDFKIGITVTKKSLKLYSDFYSSDIIVASPLGLRTIIGAEGESERDYDFLASIELLIMDQTDIFLMQNWDHIIHILNHLHMQPKSSHGTDFSRVRLWSLNGWAKYYRQTLIFSSNNLPEINAIFNKKCHNYAGKVKVINPVELGCISQVVVQVPHVFQRFDCQNAAEAIDSRFEFFINTILPQQKESLMKHTLIYIPSYFDYVRVRNYFKKEDISFVQICEYSKDGKVARARDMFYHGDAHFLLYTERFHFFHRKRIKGIKHILFYQLPTFPNFYSEICNLLQETILNKKSSGLSNLSVSVMYSKYDVFQLSAIIGVEKSRKMLHSDRKVHMMVTGDNM